MPSEVCEAVRDILIQHKDMDEAKADKIMKLWERKKKIVIESWA